ncbi:MAG: BON domain-containing protein [Verrucomicrobiota bacterium]
MVNNLQIKPAPTEAVGTPGSAVPGTTRTVVQPPPPRPEPNPPPPVRDAEDRVTVRPETLAGLPTGVRDLEISTSNGKATIRGKAPTEADKMEVERHVLQIPGVQSVDNKIEVRPPAPVRQ